MKGQLSLEFLVVLVVYLSFIGMLISAQLRYTDAASFSATKQKMQQYLLAIEGAEQQVNNRFLQVPYQFENCTIAGGRLAVCFSGNDILEVPLAYSRFDQNGDGYVS